MKQNQVRNETIMKVYDYLKKHENQTPTQIGAELSLNHYAVGIALATLWKLEKVNLITNGSTTLCQAK